MFVNHFRKDNNSETECIIVYADEKYGIVDGTGKEIIPCDYSFADYWNEIGQFLNECDCIKSPTYFYFVPMGFLSIALSKQR